MTRRLWLVRHGETEGQSSIRYHGANDVPLSDEGRGQIAALAPWLSGVDFARVVHSPQIRASESAAILIRACGLCTERVHSDARLREISFGDCEGMTAAEIEVAHPDFWAAYRAGRLDSFPGGELRSDYAARVGEVARELAEEPWTGDLLVVAHRGTVRQMLRTLLGFGPAAPDAFAVELGSLTVLREVSPPETGAFQLELLGARP